MGVALIRIQLKMETVPSLAVFGGEAQPGEQGTFKRAEGGANPSRYRAIKGLDCNAMRPVARESTLG
ncbi:hypothetical protein LBMAG38_00010 [Chloroflexota bacterium]|nr:hypothetical protein LBMAG38_00010 [Chloroflexota bacterium]